MSAEAASTAEIKADKTAKRRGKPKARSGLRVVDGIRIDPSRDALLTEFGKKTLEDRYLLPGEIVPGHVRPSRHRLCRR